MTKVKKNPISMYEYRIYNNSSDLLYFKFNQIEEIKYQSL